MKVGKERKQLIFSWLSRIMFQAEKKIYILYKYSSLSLKKGSKREVEGKWKGR